MIDYCEDSISTIVRKVAAILGKEANMVRKVSTIIGR